MENFYVRAAQLASVMVLRLLIYVAMCIPLSASAAETKVVLTANTADLTNPDDLFDIIGKYVRGSADTIVWAINGDIFPAAYEEEQIRKWQAKANNLLDLHPRLFIVLNQGDRDWLDSKAGGWQKVISIEKALSQATHPRFNIFIQHGCPGPWTLTFPNLELVVINSQWWNHPFDKPLPAADVCAISDTDNFIEELEGILDDRKTKNLMILSHFPLVSTGNYGGRFAASAYLIPPVVAFRQNVGTSRDIVNEQFDLFRHRLVNLLEDYSSVVFASGHEQNHSIQIVGNNIHVNSGALVRSGFAAKRTDAMLSENKPGVVVVTYSDIRQVDFDYQIFRESHQLKSEFKTTVSRRDLPEKVTLGRKVSSDGTAKIAAGPEYASGWMKRLWLGQHYRSSWTTPVAVPKLDLDTTNGGLNIIGKGGGRQTTSLKLVAGNGKEYVFRSVNKDPYRALGFELRGTVVADVLKDQTSTQQPYGAMAVAPLLDKVNILHAAPSLYVLPDDDRLGEWRTGYANLLGMLEERPNDKIGQGKIFAGAKSIEKSFKLFGKLYKDHNNHIDKREFARARIFDLWIGDWSKHEDNWKWAGFNDERGMIYRPVPRDRDHAFSRWDGIIPWLADREWGVPNGESFNEKIHGLRSLMWQARHLDRFVGNELTREDWINAARQIQDSVQNADIESAVRKMPSEIYEKDGKQIERKLKVRLRDLQTYSEQHYQLLAKQVDVVGSNKKESFQIIRNPDASVQVTVAGINGDGKPDPGIVYYRRRFNFKETSEIRLYGLAGDDIFEVTGQAENSILIRIISGEGQDTILDHSIVQGKRNRTLLYDPSVATLINAGNELRRVTAKNPGLYQYDRNAFTYNTYMPVVLFTYNPFIGAAFHAGVTFTRQSFSKPQFSSKHTFRASVSLKGNYDFRYTNQFRQLIAGWDGISGISISRPLNYSYFFGIGNDSENQKWRSPDYYRAQYNSLGAFAGITRTFWKRSLSELTANYEMNEGVRRRDSYLDDHSEIFGMERLNLIFVKGALTLDFRDRIALPEKGFLFSISEQAGKVIEVNDHLFTITELGIEQYLSTYWKNPLTLGLSLGAGLSGGDVPFYKKLSLGQLNDLRGYKRNRYAGTARAFLNTELRYQIIEARNISIPVKIGVRGFFDVGQVWSDGKGDASQYWHKGYGAGFYVTPFKEQFALNVSAGKSREESLLLMISVGSFFR
jgi:hypothetical protein